MNGIEVNVKNLMCRESDLEEVVMEFFEKVVVIDFFFNLLIIDCFVDFFGN